MWSTLIALLSLSASALIAFYLSHRVLHTRPKWIDETMEDFFKPDEEGKNIVDLIGEKFGRSFRMSLLAQKSGDVRHAKMIESRVMSAAVDHVPELKMGLKILKQFGLEDLANSEDLPYLLQLAKKYGIFGNLGLGPQKEKSSSDYGWNP